MAQLSLLYKQRNAEDDKDVRFIMRTFQDEGYDNERLAKTLEKCRQYHRHYGKTRANSNMMRAIEILLKTN